MILLLLFIFIVACVTTPMLIVVFLTPFAVGLLWIGAYAIRNKIKYGYCCPWEHREELKKKGIIV